MTSIGTALPPDQERAQLRAALDGYTVDAVRDLLGLIGQDAHDRGDRDLDGVRRIVAGSGRSRLRTLIALFVLGLPVPEREAASALRPLELRSANPPEGPNGDRSGPPFVVSAGTLRLRLRLPRRGPGRGRRVRAVTDDVARRAGARRHGRAAGELGDPRRRVVAGTRQGMVCGTRTRRVGMAARGCRAGRVRGQVAA